MKLTLTFKDILLISVAAIGSIFAGFINGLLGTGGGIILIFVFSYIYGEKGLATKNSFASAMATVLPISFFSLSTYPLSGRINFPFLLSIITPAALGGIAGAFVGSKVRPVLLRKIFALLTIYAGINMLH